MHDDALASLGVIPTVYSLVYPETRAAFDRLRTTPALGDMYERAWEKHQDPMHHELLETWRDWVKPVADVDFARFAHRYVSAGSSEAIRDAVAVHVAEARQAGREPVMHIFDGEYEGFPAFAAAYHCRVVRHPRIDFAASLDEHVGPHDRFFISAPSSIDGNVWDGLGPFLAHLAQRHPTVRVALDLCYVGCIGSGRAYAVPLGSPSIDTLFFSLSKVFGVYYHRVGGVLCTAERPSMYGNVWFKNLLSLRYGTALMQSHGLDEIPQKYRPHQDALVAELAAATGAAVTASDVVLLAHSPTGPAAFARAEGPRYCLTPGLDARIKGQGAAR